MPSAAEARKVFSSDRRRRRRKLLFTLSWRRRLSKEEGGVLDSAMPLNPRSPPSPEKIGGRWGRRCRRPPPPSILPFPNNFSLGHKSNPCLDFPSSQSSSTYSWRFSLSPIVPRSELVSANEKKQTLGISERRGRKIMQSKRNLELTLTIK